MTLQLTKQQQSTLRRAVENGLYETETDAIAASIRYLDLELDHLKAELQQRVAEDSWHDDMEIEMDSKKHFREMDGNLES